MNRGQRRAAWLSSHRLALQSATAVSAAVPSDVQGNQTPAFSLHVGELLLRGFDKRTASRISTRFEQQLHHLLTAKEIPGHWSRTTSLETVHAKPIHVARHSDAMVLGTKLAQAILAHPASSHLRGGGQ
jgi:hypothetical protein